MTCTCCALHPCRSPSQDVPVRVRVVQAGDPPYRVREAPIQIITGIAGATVEIHHMGWDHTGAFAIPGPITVVPCMVRVDDTLLVTAGSVTLLF